MEDKKVILNNMGGTSKTKLSAELDSSIYDGIISDDNPSLYDSALENARIHLPEHKFGTVSILTKKSKKNV